MQFNLLRFGKHLLITILFASVSILTNSFSALAQYYITVPFSNGFVGDVNNNTSANNCYYHSGASGLGWTNVQFAQNSTATIFTAQGNDIPGFAVITDNAGLEHTIPGFIKWRTNTGSTVECFVFVPTVSETLSTNSFNGSSTYTITTNHYIGLTKNGQVLTISPVPGPVTGNSAGVLNDLNAYLGSFPTMSINDVTVGEAAGTATLTVTLSAASTSIINVNYTTSNGTALSGTDYTTTTGSLTIPAGQTSVTFTIPILNDATYESTESFTVTLTDPTNVSILDASGTVTITDNDSNAPSTNSTGCDPQALYDIIGSAYHQSVAQKSDGSWSGWGAYMASSGAAAVLSPQEINATNYPGLTGTPIRVATASSGSGSLEQSVLLTTTGLFAWGVENVIFNTNFTTSAAFQKLTINGQTNGLPSGVNPTDVEMLLALDGVLGIVTISGNAYILNNTTSAVYQGNGGALTNAAWSQVKINSTTNLSNVIAIRGQIADDTHGALMALTYDGSTYKIFTWGTTTYLGNSTAAASRNYASEMTMPAGLTPKMIAVTGGTSVARNNSYFVLGTNGQLMALGSNDKKQLGDFTTTERQAWVNVKRTASANFTNVAFISAQEHDAKFPAAAAITSTGDLYMWGQNGGNMLGNATVDAALDPFLPGGFTSGTDIAKIVEVGGHTSVYLKENSAKFCYVGHQTAGSMGDGTATDSNPYLFDCSATPVINICGSTGWDLGDAPIDYENGGGSNYAMHFYVSEPNLYLGSGAPTANDDNPHSVVIATDNNGSNGDGIEENGVSSFPTMLNTSTSYTFPISVFNNSGATANLYVWVDWNNNGKFQASEFYTTTVASSATAQTKTASFTGLSGLADGRRYVRIRLSTFALTDNATTTTVDERSLGFLADGEVEDHSFFVTTSNPNPNVAPVTNNVTNAAAIPLNASATDIDSGSSTDSDGTVVAYRVTSLPAHGTLFKQIGLSLILVNLNEAMTVADFNALKYEPNTGYSGSDLFTYAAIDDDGAEDLSPANFNINTNTLSTADAGPATASICAGNTYTTAGSSSNGTILWTTSGTGTFTNATTNTATYTPSAADITAGSVTLTISVTSNVTISDNIVLTINPATSAGTLSGTQGICVGSTTTFTSTVSGGAWSSATTAVATVNSSTGVVTGLTAGTSVITYTITGTGGCADATATRTVTVTAAPIAGTISGNQSVCVGSTTQFTANNSSANATALDFDGVDDYATAPAGVYFDDNTFTIESWVYITAHNNYQRLFDFGNGITNNNVLFVLSEATNGKPGFNIYNASGQGHFINSPNPLPLNQWVHLAAVRNGTFAGIYVNGTLVVSANDWTVSTPNAIRNNCYIGKDNWGSNVTMGAKVGEFRIWTTAKTQAEIQANMNSVTAPQADLRLLYKFDQGLPNLTNTGLTTINDNSGANYNSGAPANATMTNFALTGSTSNWTNGQTTAPTGTWTSSNTAVATVNSSGVVTGVAAGTATITFTLTGSGGCADATATRTVTVTAAPTAATISGTTTICSNSSATLSASVSGGSWTSATTSVATINSSTGVVTPVSAGTSVITYTVTGTGGCANATTNSTVTINATPNAPTVSSPYIACPGNTIAVLPATIGSGETLEWYAAATGGSALATTTSLVAGTTYYAQASNASGCASSRTPLVVVFNNAIDFDAVDDYVNTGDILENLGDMTVEAWVYWRGSAQAHSEIFTKDNVSSFAITAANKLHANFGDGSVWIAGLDSQNPIPLNKWTHVAVSRQSGVVKMYINGVLDAATVTNNGNGQNSAPRIIGGKMVGSSTNATLFNGKIDEVRFWNVARSAAQISANLTTQYQGNETNLLAYYNFNQGVQNGNNTAITTLTNSVNSANNGTITNFTLNGIASNFVAGYFPEIAGNTSLLVGATTTLTHAVSGGTWSSSNTSIATINSSGVVTGVAAGTITITYSNCGQSATYLVTVISNASLTINSSSITSFAACAGSVSAAQTITVSGTSLTANAVVTAPTGYEVSLSSGSGYASSVTITASGTLSATTVYVRLSNTAATGSVNGTLTVASTGATSQTVSLTGTVTAAPSAGTLSGTQAICVGATTNFTSTAAGGAWTSGTTSVATVNASGVVTGVSEGTATITYTVTGTGGCANATATRTVTVTAAPSAGTLSGTQEVCVGSTTTYSVTGASTSIGTALDFDGSNDYVSLPTGVYFDDNTFTIEGWVYIKSHANWQRLIDFGNGAYQQAMIFALSAGTSGRPHLEYYAAPNQTVLIESPTALPLNQWVHVAAVVDGTNAAIYVDGISVVSTSSWNISTNNVSRSNCYIGKSNWPDALVNAKINELRIWSTAKTQAEIQANMNANLAPQADLRLLYKFDQGVPNQTNTGVTSLVDQSGANYINSAPVNGTLNNFALTGNTSNWTTGRTIPANGTWSSSNTAVATVNASGVVTGVSAGTATITYTVTGTGGCANATATRTVTVTAAPSAGTISGTTAVCSNGTSTLSSTVSGGSWTSGTPAVATINSSTGVVTPLTAGTSVMTYTVSGTGGCANATATSTVTITAAPSAGTLSGTQAICVGSTTNFTSTVSGGAWTSGTTSVATVNASGVVTGVSAGTATITYTATGTGGCANATATRIVTVTSLPSTPSATAVQPTCAVTTGSINISTQTGVEYSINGTTYGATASFTGLTAGVYPISVRSTANNACITTGTSITLNAALGAPAAATASVTAQPICGTPTGTIVVTAPTGVLEYAINAGTYQAGLTFAGLAPGNYNVTVRRTADITCVSTATTLTVNPVPNCIPVANNDNATTAEDNPAILNITANDTDLDGTINVNSIDLDPATPGQQTSVSTTAGLFSVNAGILTFYPAANYNGPASITYTVNDNSGATSNVATVSITVTPVNDAPIANNDAAST
ncbi:MAG: hypothetical protein RLZZ65_1178, partial [Bacteroidota bacterium]